MTQIISIADAQKLPVGTVVFKGEPDIRDIAVKRDDSRWSSLVIGGMTDLDVVGWTVLEAVDYGPLR